MFQFGFLYILTRLQVVNHWVKYWPLKLQWLTLKSMVSLPWFNCGKNITFSFSPLLPFILNGCLVFLPPSRITWLQRTYQFLSATSRKDQPFIGWIKHPVWSLKAGDSLSTGWFLVLSLIPCPFRVLCFPLWRESSVFTLLQLRGTSLLVSLLIIVVYMKSGAASHFSVAVQSYKCCIVYMCM